MKDRLWEINHGFEWPEPDEVKVSSPVPRGVGLSDGPRLPDLNMTPEPPEKGECEEDTSLKSPLYQKKRPMSSHDKYLIFNVFCVFLKVFRKDVI